MRYAGDVTEPLSRPLRVSIHGLFALGVLYTLFLAAEVILPVVLAVMVSLLLSPPVAWAARRRIPKALSAFVLLAGLVAAVGGLGAAISQPVLDWLEEAPRGIAQLTLGDSELHDAYQRMARSAEEVEQAIADAQDTDDDTADQPIIVQQEESWRQQLAVGAGNTGVVILLALTLTFFLLVSGDRLISNFARLLGERADRRATLQMIRDAQRHIAGYLAFITISNSLVGVAMGMIVWLIGLPEPIVWGVVTAVLRFVPYLGVLLTVVLLAVISAVTFSDPWMILAAPGAYVVLSSLVGFIVEPYFHGYRLAINPAVIFIAIFFWGWLWGAIGVLIAVPLMTVIQVILRGIPRLKPVYRLISA